MAKILIYEDSAQDICSRYGALLREHDVSIRYMKKGARRYQFNFTTFEEPILDEAGFKDVRLIDSRSRIPEEEADVFFCDGLEGRFQNVLDKLPRSRAFLHSSNPEYMMEAEQQGFSTYEGRIPVTELVLRVLETYLQK